MENFSFSITEHVCNVVAIIVACLILEKLLGKAYKSIPYS